MWVKFSCHCCTIKSLLCFEKKHIQKPTHPTEVERVLNIPTHRHGPLHFSFTTAQLARHGLANDFPSSPQISLYSRVQQHALPNPLSHGGRPF
jgi:hypothetical protein